MHQRAFRGQRTEGRCLIHRVAGFEHRECGLKFFQKLVGQFFDHDEAFSCDAALTHVVHLRPHRPLDRFVEVGIVEHDERIAAAQFHRGLLEIFSGSGRDTFSSFHAAGQRDAFDPGIVNHAIHLVVRNKQIGICTRWRARVPPQFFKRDGALRHTARVLHHDDIARHQIRRGKTRELIVGKIPRLHAKEHAERGVFNHGFARLRFENLRSEKILRVPCVVVENVRAQRDFTARLGDELAHFKCHRLGEFIRALAHDRGGLRDDDCPLGKSFVPPSFKTSCGSFNRCLQLRVREFFELLHDFTIGGIDTLITHKCNRILRCGQETWGEHPTEVFMVLLLQCLIFQKTEPSWANPPRALGPPQRWLG